MGFYQLLSAAAAVLILTGCGKQEPARMTQQIVPDGMQPGSTVQEQQSSSQPAHQSAPAQAGTPQELSELQPRFYQVKAEQDALEIEIENLEVQYRMGELEESAFLEQKKALIASEQALDLEEDRLELQIRMLRQPTIPTGDPEDLFNQLLETEATLELIESQEDAADYAYQMGEITREEYIAQRSEQIAQEEELDELEEALEDALELLGWDD